MTWVFCCKKSDCPILDGESVFPCSRCGTEGEPPEPRGESKKSEGGAAGPSCGECRYFILSAVEVLCDGEHRYGHCHCRAPVTGKRGAAEWPSVWGDYWCGDFEHRPGTNLTAAEVDENFSELDQRIESLEDNPPTADS